MLKSLAIFSGSSNHELTGEICRYLEIAAGSIKISNFSDGETFVSINENVRGVNCFVIQPTCNPVNEHLMELLIIIDALKRASAGSIVCILPYYGYARQDRKVKPRTPISAKLVANLITVAGASRVLMMDLHAGQIQGFFDIPVDHLSALPVLFDKLRDNFSREDLVIVSPDAGGVERAREYSMRLRCPLAIIDKRRPEANKVEVMNMVGKVEGKKAIIVDDMIDTAGTLCKAATAIMDHGATEVYALAAHGIFSGDAIENVNNSPLKKIWVTNTMPLSPEAKLCEKIEQLSVGRLLGEAIKRIHHGDSISSLFI
ncbi:ribose-phosphate pyrophosphokinase [Myxococcota bacterium]|nr:ribose-phosphate pyrophosphokinase [Myxococcota bacterium]MBU1533700.1 ribose-phosphate pyrophosphokinase [Myxococcota bacterium]